MVTGDMTKTEPKVSSTLDFSSDRKHQGHLSIPHSRNDSGWGATHLTVVSLIATDM
jgi:hypothetical protein